MRNKLPVKTVIKGAISACVAKCREVLAAADRLPTSARPSPLNWRDPARSGLQCLVWLAAKGLAFTLAAGKIVFELLTQASADVGEAFIRRHGGEA